MAQKSLPILNKVGTSMVWYTTYYYKHYKWLSSQNLYLLYFFNKLFVYLDFFFYKLFWLDCYTKNLYYSKRQPVFARFSKIRFFKPVTSYLINVNHQHCFFNIYYKTTLATFQKLNETVQVLKPVTRSELQINRKLSALFFRM